MIEPYYSDATVSLYHGDCLEILPEIPSGSIHHAVTDPPYTLATVSSSVKGSKTGGWADLMNASVFYTAWYSQVKRVLKHTGSLWSFGNWRTIPCMMRAAIDADLPAVSLLVWDKKWIGPAGPKALRSQHEVCMVMAREGFLQPDRSQGDVLSVQASPQKPTGHPAEKPEPLMQRIVQLTGGKPGQIILDPFAGSGTTLVAAKSLGFRAVGIESEERWCEVAANRLSQDTLIFDGAA